MRVSACIICKNEAGRIALALDSAAWCEEIVVVDSGSTDATVEICRNHASGKVRVIGHDWEGFTLQRKFAAEQCGNGWVLMLDADEECSPELAAEIGALQDPERVAIFEMPRKNYVAGRYVRSWSPDHQSRLIHKDRVMWGTQSIPEVREPMPGFTIARLKEPLIHARLTEYSPSDFNDGRKMELYANQLAETLWARNKRATFLNLLFRPLATFIKLYIFKGAFLDGRFGLVTAYRTTIGVMLKYSVLYGRELEKQALDRKKK